jgi:GNAT superfamily N-acetyltransferase
VIDLPDLPRWVEAHGIASDPASWGVALGAGRAVGSDAAQLIVVIGDAAPAELARLARDRPGHTILCAIEREDLARATGRPFTRALLHTLAEPDALPDLEGAVALPADASLAHVPAALAAELARARHPVWCVFLDGIPVSFAYAPWRSARWFDVSVDTLPEARQLGLGRIVAAAMIHAERALGREPVWGADEANAGSRALAHALGFAPIDALWVAPCAP